MYRFRVAEISERQTRRDRRMARYSAMILFPFVFFIRGKPVAPRHIAIGAKVAPFPNGQFRYTQYIKDYEVVHISDTRVGEQTPRPNKQRQSTQSPDATPGGNFGIDRTRMKFHPKRFQICEVNQRD